MQHLCCNYVIPFPPFLNLSIAYTISFLTRILWYDSQPTSKPTNQPVTHIDTGLIVAVTSITGLAFLFMLFSLLDGVFRPKLTEDEKHRVCLKYIIDSWGYHYHPVERNGIQRRDQWNRRDGRERKDDDDDEEEREREEQEEQEEVEQAAVRNVN